MWILNAGGCCFEWNTSGPGLPHRKVGRHSEPYRRDQAASHHHHRRSRFASEQHRVDGSGGKATARMTLAEFRHVRARIQPHIRKTPVVCCDIPDLFLKLENLQVTHSFKIRGAFAHLVDLVERGEKRTVLTVSARNHGQAVARAASMFRLPCTVVVPASAPRT